MFIDSRNMTAACDDLADGPGVPPDQIEAARRTVASFAVGDTLAEQVADTELLMAALGIHPAQELDLQTRASLPKTSVSSASIRGSHF